MRGHCGGEGLAETEMRRMRRKLRGLLILISLVIALGVPATSFWQGAAQTRKDVQAELGFAAEGLSRLATQAPNQWFHEKDLLQERINAHLHGNALHFALYRGQDRLLTVGGSLPPWPRVTRETYISDGFETVGRLEVSASLNPVLWNSIVLFCAGVVVSLSLGIVARDVICRLMDENVALRTRELEGRNESLSNMLQALEEATVSKAFLDRLLSSLFEALIVVGPDGRIRRVNEAAALLLGYADGRTMVSIPFNHVIMGCDPRPTQDDTGPARQTAAGCEAQVLTRYGNLVPVLMSVAVIEGEWTEGRTLVYSLWDITDRKRAEAELESSRRRLNELLESVTEGFCSYDRFWRCTYMNENALAILNKTRDEVLSRPIWQQFPTLKGTKFVARVLQTAMKGHKSTFVHYDDLANTWWSFDLNPYQEGFSLILRDISDRKRAEEQVRRMNWELEERVSRRTAELREAQAELVRQGRLATLGQLTATVSHELRNPLGVITNSVFVVRRLLESADPRLIRAVDRIERSVGRCDRIIDEMLEFARRRPLQVSTVALAPWLREVVGEVNIPDGLVVTVSIEPDTVSAEIDREAMRRVVLNLLENALQAMQYPTLAPAEDDPEDEPGQLVVRCRLVDESVELTILDSGAGIPETVLPRIFEPLYSTKGFGAGLGLPIVKRIIESHGGTIAISNRRDRRGAYVQVRFPSALSGSGTVSPPTEKAA